MRYLQWFGAMLGAVALATAGEAVWELLIKPAYPAILNFFVHISTFGLESLEDKIYQEVAIGNYERTSLLVFVVINAFFLATASMLPFAVFIIRRKIVRLIRRMEEGATRMERDSISKIKADARRFLSVVRYFFPVASIISILTLGSIIFSVASTIYEVRAEANLRQLFKIDAPFLDAKKLQELESKAASLKNRNDYTVLVGGLREIARQHHIEPPYFDIMS